MKPCAMSKRQVGVGVAALCALLAEGRNFSRDELNAMLDKLAASPYPKVRMGPQATCYKMAMPQLERFEYVCKKCGSHTVYPENRLRIANMLARYRDEAASLRTFGLDITLDESALCRKCKSAKDLGIPTHGRIISEPTSKREKKSFFWKVGDEVAIKSYGSLYCQVRSVNFECWVNAKYISEDGVLLGSTVNVRTSPSLDGIVYAQFSKGGKLKRLPARSGDPNDWVRVGLPDSFRRFDFGDRVPTRFLGGFSYDEGKFATPSRLGKLAWVINGKCTVVQVDDAKILKAFLTGDKTWAGKFDEQTPVKNSLNRLRELLDPDYTAPKPVAGYVDADVDVGVEGDL